MCFSQPKKAHRSTPPPSINQNAGDNPNQTGAPGLGSMKPHVPDRNRPYTIRPRPEADSTAPTVSSVTPSSAGVSAIRLEKARMPAITTTSPMNTQRHEKYVVQMPPINGPAATAMAIAADSRP